MNPLKPSQLRSDGDERSDKESWSSLPTLQEITDDERLIIDDNCSPEIEAPLTKRLLAKANIIHYCTCDPDVVVPRLKQGKMVEVTDEQVSKFICTHNLMRGGNITRLNPEGVAAFFKAAVHRAVITTENGLLIGVIFTRDMNLTHIKQSDEELKIEQVRTGCTTFMVVHKSFRGLGMAMALIKQAILIGVDIDAGPNHTVQSGYHLIDRSVGLNAVKLNMWFRPINIKATLESKHPIPKANQVKDPVKRIKILERLYQPYDLPQYRIQSAADGPEAFIGFLKNMDLYKTRGGKGTFCWTPSRELLTRFTKAFDALTVIEIGRGIIGCFAMYTIDFLITPESDPIPVKAAWLMFLKAANKEDSITVLKNAIEYARYLKLPYMLMHEVGDLTDEVLTEVKAINSKSHNMLDYFNIGISPDVKQIHIPLL